MSFDSGVKWARCGAVMAAALLLSGGALAFDEEAAKTLARQNNCFKCHGVDKKKEGPAWREVAAKYKGKPDAEAKLLHHVTSGEKATFPDGHVEEHKVIKAKDPAEIKNLVQFILSLQ